MSIYGYFKDIPIHETTFYDGMHIKCNISWAHLMSIINVFVVNMKCVKKYILCAHLMLINNVFVVNMKCALKSTFYVHI